MLAFRIFGTLALAATLVIVARSRRHLAETTLLAAWRWMLAGVLVWIMAWSLPSFRGLASEGLLDHLWYATAVLMLCPPIAVLGSRRPGAQVWTGFVLVPLLLVLGWPALVGLVQPGPLRGLQLEVPPLLGYGLVMVMGVGNYVGTRSTFAAILYGAALILLVAPLSAAVPESFPEARVARIAATLCLSAAGFIAWRTLSSVRCQVSGDEAHEPRSVGLSSSQLSTFNVQLLWRDFRDAFGIVWARRIQDRINTTAEKEHWPARLELDGFVWTAPADDATLARIEHTLRWLLRRFVDDTWIDRRLRS